MLNAVEPEPKKRAKAKARLTNESSYVLEEEVSSLMEQLSHHGTSIPRVPNTIELNDFFTLTKKKKVSPEDACYEVEQVLSLAEAKAAGIPDVNPQGDLAALVNHYVKTREDFGEYTRLEELDTYNYVERKLQAPVGYSATTRLHMGRLCVPVLNDSGATCSVLTEEQVVLLLNHTAYML